MKFFSLLCMIYLAAVPSGNEVPEHLYKIVSPEDWQKSQEKGMIPNSSIDEKFIHLATKEQLPRIAQKFWDKKDYVILTLDVKKLVGRLVYEANPGGQALYYHLYEGKIPLNAVVETSNSNYLKN